MYAKDYTRGYTFCLTSYPARMHNLPAVVDALWKQTVPPKEVVLTICHRDYMTMRPVIMDILNRCNCCNQLDIFEVAQDTKVWKKFLPASMRMGSEDLIITVDDDRIMPPTMAEELLTVYAKTGNPVSGNDVWRYGYKCHCGPCSLVWPKMFTGWDRYYQEWQTMPSDDMFYTMLAAKNGYRYEQSPTGWEKDIPAYNEGKPYSIKGMVPKTYKRILTLFKWI